MKCYYCSSQNIGVKERLGNKTRYQCHSCNRSWTVRAKESGEVELSDEHNEDDRVITTKSKNIKTLEELTSYSKVDLDKWEVYKHVINSWEVTMGKKNAGSSVPQTYTNYQVKAWLRLKEQKHSIKDELEAFKHDAKSYSPKYKSINYPKSESGNMLEISIYDHHFGQLSWGKETGGENYDVKVSSALAIDAIEYILSKVEKGSLEKILIVIGNDFFNVNSQANTTYSGTPQSEDDRWKKTYKKGRELWVSIIDMCMAIAPVDVVIIPGNHDEERIFHLGDSLECWYHKCKDVNIDNSPMIRKYYKWGNCLLGFTHGDKEVKGTLVNVMATEEPIKWSQTVYREWHKGHLHAAKTTAFQVLDEYRGVRERILPSLVSIDDWHAGKGYSALRETQAFIWNKSKGNTTIFTYHPN